MKSYEINSRTLAIVPVGENLTNVLEEDNEVLIWEEEQEQRF